MNDIKFETKFIDISDNRFKFIVLINGVKFNYFLGLGHCSKLNNDKTSIQYRITGLEKDLRVEICKAIYGYNKNISMWDYEQLNIIYIKRPKLEEVLNCLFMDAEARNSCFEDWCSDFGYSDDSIKAKNIYDSCVQNGIKLKSSLGDKYHEIKKEIEALNEQ